MKIKRHYYLMISCPSDVINERKLLKECVEIINSERTDDVWVELQYWVTDTSSDAGTPAQESINEQIVRECDGLIAIFNARLGTPVHDFKCGTDEEIQLMLKANKHVSLLFNTKPVIDLSNPTSIDQITKLQEYKNEQSKTAYYREFSDSDSFSVLAKREILLWLRSIVKKDSSEGKLIEAKLDEGKSVVGEPSKEQEKSVEENKIEKEDSIDVEAGAIDCVIYITEAAGVLTDEVNSFAKYSNDLSQITTAFGDKFKFLKKQGNGNAGILIACKEFAKEIDYGNEKLNHSLDVIELKWNEIYRYLLIVDKATLSHEDKVILKDSVLSLKQGFEQSVPQIEELIATLNATPNIQKDISRSVNKLSALYKRFKIFATTAAENCDELDVLFTC